MRKAEFITSAANPLLKDVRRALTRGGLTGEGCCVAETFHLLEEALHSGCRVRTVIAGEGVRHAVESHLRGFADTRLVVAPDKLLDATAAIETSQGVVALVEPPQWSVEQALGKQQLALVLDGIQDPGNLGTILRSAEAFGATGLLLLKGTVSPFNPKSLRASAGSVFRVPFVQGLDEAPALAALRQSGVELYAAVPNRNGRPPRQLRDVDLTRPCALVIGSEGRGVSERIRAAATDLCIPTVGVESLNAAIAAAVLLYEARRQRDGSA